MTDRLTVTLLLTDKQDLGRSLIATREESAAAAPGEVVLEIDRLALTTNNITYAAFGDAMGYWGFFPTGRADWGHMPAWGFAEVLSSGVEGVDVGERFYGYYPIASHVRMQAERVTSRGFYDGSAHRKALTSAYNQYGRCSQDPVHAVALESYQALIRPLFITSFMLVDFLEDSGFFGARRLVISSASSKTAYGTAFCLASGEGRGIERLGLTSARNEGFVQSLGCYDAVARYDDIAKLDTAVPTLYVDFSGDVTLRSRIHHHLGPALVYDCYAGSAANTEFLRDQDLPGPAPQFYFAPVQIKKRNADWGPAVVNERFNAAQQRFIARISDKAHPWLTLVEAGSFAAAQAVIAALNGNGGDPREGHVVRLG
ncbi:DUF2855 family protein [Phreatobacter stygius]|uniref:DUF2855 family protein n=1 Tax=Phreatobacter stygius TaxID=1940610 RepID=A0A4D7AYA2_9HYPH|nr:DUF2855 family protein [Phreatobacter stygius]QCI66269.1 DUF2855 family protein [Phreatobacter stygius]